MTRQRRHGWGLLAAMLGVTPAAPGYALQPLNDFVDSSKRHNPDNHEARAALEQRSAEREAAAARYLPSFRAQGVYTRNQYDASITLPDGPAVTISPQDGLDAYFTLAVPLVDVGAWQQQRAASAAVDVAAASRSSTELSVEGAVTQAYYQLLGSEAVLFAARQSVGSAQDNLKLVRDRHELGTASELDLQRAVVDVARAQRDVATADQGVVAARRALESLARLSPEPATPESYHEDDLHEEAPLAAWLGGPSQDLVAAQPAVLAVEAADRARAAARAAWLPTLAAQAQERITNAAGFAGRAQYYTLMATATWAVDFSLAPGVAAQTAAVAVARARENKARRAAEDAIYQAWYQVRIGIEEARAARAQVESAALAQGLAKTRYESGVATQLEVVQAQRDFFAAAVARAQADFDLQYSRALLRLSARRSGAQEAVQ